jgi:hypothetical protein
MEGSEYNEGYKDAREDFINGKLSTLFTDVEKSESYRDGYLSARDDLKNLMKQEMPPEIRKQMEEKEVQAYWPLPW